MKKGIFLFVISMLMIGILAACGTNNDSKKSAKEKGKEEKKVLKMGTASDYPPFEFVDTAKSNEIIGFDIDLVKMIGDKLGYEIKVQDYDFSGLIPALQAGKLDLVLSGMTPTAERKESVDFSDVYYEAKHMIVSQKDSKIETLDDLNGKTLGVQLASIQEEKANELAESLELKVEKRDRIPELVQEILAGRFDAAIIEDKIANGYLKENKDLVGFTIEEDSEEAGYAIAFPKDSELTEEFNKALKELMENGELEKLEKKRLQGE
ncbi:transporter substrate-binding domain-containing protein [Bacillus aquiflavi]|uniref:transporter substrate-binding domain-containing protein n=1 Tax=Bacillus aquiflavi TaxID=2672567 RepID=UPI001CA7DD3D|nr:transporter substrate-binding domain-containing protein [Bacillus aquiflavi]UAC47176.1 transporter substrate-binding domain-containing protein [Bacillus aquiflavi]